MVRSSWGATPFMQWFCTSRFSHLFLEQCEGTVGGDISDEIYDGSLSRFLVYPVSFFYFKYFSTLARSTIAGFQLLVVLGAFIFLIGIPDDVGMTPLSVIMGFSAILVSSTIYFSMSAGIQLMAFWADQTWSLQVMLRLISGILGGALVSSGTLSRVGTISGPLHTIPLPVFAPCTLFSR